MQAIHFLEQQRFHFIALGGEFRIVGEVELFRVRTGKFPQGVVFGEEFEIGRASCRERV